MRPVKQFTMKFSIQLIGVLIFLFISSSLMAQQNDCPCCTENHEAFDFWIGDWEVFNKDGTMVGKNTIEKIQDKCILKENWRGNQGSTGTSLNFYNLKTQQWEQLWVDNTGSHLKLKGNRVGNQMILSSEVFIHNDGKEYVNRITWTQNEDGTVRQLWEILQGGEAVRILFDGLYRKAK